MRQPTRVSGASARSSRFFPRIFETHGPGEPEHVAIACSATCGAREVHRIEHNYAVVATFEHPGGGTVFNASCTDWAYGLEGGDPASRA